MDMTKYFGPCNIDEAAPDYRTELESLGITHTFSEMKKMSLDEFQEGKFIDGAYVRTLPKQDRDYYTAQVQYNNDIEYWRRMYNRPTREASLRDLKNKSKNIELLKHFSQKGYTQIWGGFDDATKQTVIEVFDANKELSEPEAKEYYNKKKGVLL